MKKTDCLNYLRDKFLDEMLREFGMSKKIVKIASFNIFHYDVDLMLTLECAYDFH